MIFQNNEIWKNQNQNHELLSNNAYPLLQSTLPIYLYQNFEYANLLTIQVKNEFIFFKLKY